jgi:3-deoxy-D-manno-octulosonic acid kinase
VNELNEIAMARQDISPQEIREDGSWILYDAAAIDPPGLDFFDPERLEAQGQVVGAEQGRGAVCIFRQGESEYVLRHYRRGGLVARLSHDRYVWTGLSRTRAWREWHLLAWMHERGLAVPRPVAARVRRRGAFYTADLVTLRLARVWTLADLLGRWALPEDAWREIGATIASFHAAGVCHADLNARNIVLDDAGKVFLLDFDRARRMPGQGRWQQANLERLRRSLDKFGAEDIMFRFEEQGWDWLMDGYSAADRREPRLSSGQTPT